MWVGHNDAVAGCASALFFETGTRVRAAGRHLQVAYTPRGLRHWGTTLTHHHPPAADEKGETVPVSDDEADGDAQVGPVGAGGGRKTNGTRLATVGTAWLPCLP